MRRIRFFVNYEFKERFFASRSSAPATDHALASHVTHKLFLKEATFLPKTKILTSKYLYRKKTKKIVQHI